MIVTTVAFQKAIFDLINLRELVAITNFSLIQNRLTLFDEVMVIKQSYFNIKAILLNIPAEVAVRPTLRLYIDRPIHTAQLDGWVAKMQINFQTFVTKNMSDIELQKAFISEQCFLIDTIVKVLNGDAYFTGCPQ
ncbi:MAG: hypothetical protein ACD_84C00013G0002 [uncultured bacterium]|nr:MAG: hypothetical protein ACD_84C00013G0002 [uncultured bacterium]